MNVPWPECCERATEGPCPGQDGLDLVWQCVETVNDSLPSLGHRDSILTKLDGHHDESNVLRCVSLGGSDTDFGTSVDVDTTVGLSRHGDPTVLTTPRQRAPRSKQYRRARMVSAVSPDCETKTQTSSRKMGVLRSKKSEASSTETGISSIPRKWHEWPSTSGTRYHRRS